MPSPRISFIQLGTGRDREKGLQDGLGMQKTVFSMIAGTPPSKLAQRIAVFKAEDQLLQRSQVSHRCTECLPIRAC